MNRANAGNLIEKKLRDVRVLKIVDMADVGRVPSDDLLDPRNSLHCAKRSSGMKIHKKFKILTGILNPLPSWALVRIIVEDHNIGMAFLLQQTECIEKELFGPPNGNIPITNMKNIHRMRSPFWNFVSSVDSSSLVKNAN